MRVASALIAALFLGLGLFAYHDHGASRERVRISRHEGPSAAPVRGADLDRVRYELVVDATDTAPVEGGFRVRSSRGDAIEIRGATVTSYLAALSPCAPESRATDASGTTMGVLRALVLPAIAHAGHTARSDASELLAPRIESLSGASGELVWGERTFARRRYCGVQYVATRATTPETVGRFEQLATLHADVRVLATGTRPERTLVVHTTLAGGEQETLDAAFEADAAVPSHAAVVRIERDLGASFRDVDFSLEGRELERAVLRGLADATRIRVLMRSRTAD